MKTYKKKEHSPIFKPFCVGKKTQLGVGVLLYFDLAAPDALLSDQELWKTIPEELERGKSKSPALDEGMPKQRGEFLVLGKCFALAGDEAKGLDATVHVGHLKKTLTVFGDRYWSAPYDAIATMSAPTPFTSMDICWENAFGGPGFTRNPVGKGVAPVITPTGEKRRPLPNVELRGQLIGAPSARPRPAGFGPLDMAWPQRSSKTGTFDDAWKKERWPYLPADMDYEFFNLAPEDQRLPVFFRGNEEIHIERMHAHYARIDTRLPAVRVRCLVCRSLKRDERVVDVPLRPETLWLFPNILRGVLIFRGVTEVLSEDLDDVRWIYLATEPLSEPAKPLDFHLEEQKKMSSLGVPIDPNLMQSIAAKVDKAMSQVRAIPRQIEAAKKRAMGQAPVMPNRPHAVVAQAKDVIVARIADMQQMQKMALDLNAQHGPVFSAKKFDFGPAIAQLKKASGQLDAGMVKLDKDMAGIDKMKKDLGTFLKTKVPAEHLAKTGLDPDNLAPDPFSRGAWHNRGFPFVADSRIRLDNHQPGRQVLASLGYDRGTMSHAWLGLNLVPQTELPPAWGLPEVDSAGNPAQAFELPPGLVMPYFEGPELKRLRIRPLAVGDIEPESLFSDAKDLLAPGSVETPLFLPGSQGAPIVRVADELEAWYVEQEVGDLCGVAVLKTAASAPATDAKVALDAAPTVVVLLPADEALAEPEWKAFKKLFPKAKPLRLPKASTLAAAAAGFDLRGAVMELLDIHHTAEDGRVSAPPGPPDASFMRGFKPPVGDIAALVQTTIKDLTDFVKAKTAPLDGLRERVMAKAMPGLLQAKLDPATFLSVKPEPVDYKALGVRMVKEIDKERDRLVALGLFKGEPAKNLMDTRAIVQKVTAEADVLYIQGMVRVKAAEETCAKLRAGELPPEVASQLQAAGVDPKRLKKPDPTEVLAKLGRGESLAGANLNGLDLSGLDLSGIDLTQAMCVKTRFVGTKLDRATMVQIMATGADFTQASLRGANLRMGLCVDAACDHADFSQADLTQTLFSGASLRKAVFRGARIYSTVLENTDLTEADFQETTAELSIFSSAVATAACFKAATLLRCFFNKTQLDQADFSEAVLPATFFQAATGAKVKFTAALMNNTRMAANTAFPGADFTDAQMTLVCFIDTDLRGAIFRNCDMSKSILQGCDLREAFLEHVEAVEARWAKSDLSRARLMGVNLGQGSLRMATLYGADLRGANLFGVDFYKARLDRHTQLDGANLKRAVFLQTFMDTPEHDTGGRDA